MGKSIITGESWGKKETRDRRRPGRSRGEEDEGGGGGGEGDFYARDHRPVGSV